MNIKIMKKTVLFAMLFLFVGVQVGYAKNPKLGYEKKIAIELVKEKIEVIKEKEKTGTATDEEKTKKTEYEERLKNLDLGQAKTIQEFMKKLDDLKKD